MLSRTSWLGGIAALLICAGLFFGVPAFQRAIRSVFWPLIQPLSGVTQQVFVRRATTGGTPEEMQNLHDQIAHLAVDQARLDALEEENQTLRDQGKFLRTSGYDSVGARVISRVLEQDHALLLLDRGANDHVEIGQAVTAGEGIFIGKIVSINERVATVELLTDVRSRVAATLSGENKALGVVEGRGNGAARMTYIPASQPLKKDQIIVTSGTEEKVPPHLPLGLVNAVEGKKTDPFVNAVLEPLIAVDRLTFVSILRPSALRPD